MLVVFFFVQIYSKHKSDSSLDMESFIATANKIYGRSDTCSTQLKYETEYNAERINRSTFLFDNLLILLICLFYEPQQDTSVEEIARLALEGDYSFFIPSLRISKESLEVLSLLLCGGEEMGRVDPLQQVIPSSFLEESGYYDVFNLIILIENNITISSFSHWIRQSESLYRPVLFNRSQDELCTNSPHPADTLSILKCQQCLIEDETQYSYPAFS